MSDEPQEQTTLAQSAGETSTPVTPPTTARTHFTVSLTTSLMSADLVKRGALGAVLVAVCFVSGLLTITSYLHHLGVFRLDVSFSRSLLTGALFLIPSFFVLCGTVVGIRLGGDAYRALTPGFPIWQRLTFAFAIGLVVPAIPVLAVRITVGLETDISPTTAHIWRSLFSTLIMEVLAVLPVATWPLVQSCVKSLWSRTPGPVAPDVAWVRRALTRRFPEDKSLLVGIRAWCFGAALFAFLGANLFFALRVYPVLPRAIGGGRGEIVRLSLTTAAVPLVQEIGVTVPDGTHVTEPVVLLWTSETSIVLVIWTGTPEARHVVELDRSLIVGIAQD